MISINVIKQSIKIKIKYVCDYYKMLKNSPSEKVDRNKKYVFIFFAADYNNLGDLAITYCQENFIKNIVGETYQIIKVTESETYPWIKEIKKMKRENVLITLIGGGNHGSLYEFIEEPRRFILKYLNNYKIVSFPQTVVYEKTNKALVYEREFIKLCKKCTDLILIAREHMSYSYYKNIYGTKAFMTPDIVFSLDFKMDGENRDGIAFVLRSDKEKAIDSGLQESLIQESKIIFTNVYFWDTCDIYYENDNRKELIDQYLKKLSSVKIVVTDRLHGMIFCYITKTPCVVLDNKNGKIKATFETWLENQNFIKMYDAEKGMREYQILIRHLSELSIIKRGYLDQEFDSLRQLLSDYL